MIVKQITSLDTRGGLVLPRSLSWMCPSMQTPAPVRKAKNDGTSSAQSSWWRDEPPLLDKGEVGIMVCAVRSTLEAKHLSCAPRGEIS
jgi:hypothetical protein